jgi:probable phosphoglycerate mutase
VQFVLLVRHGQAAAPPGRLVGRTPGIRLSPEGLEQVEAAARRLRPLRLSAVYSSPLERCRETAEVIARGRGVDVRLEKGVVEVDFGSWQGRPYKTLGRTALWRTVQLVPSAATFPGGESIRQLQARAVEAIERLRQRHRRGTIAVVSHADVIKVIAAHYLGMHLDLYQRIVIPTASVTAFGFGAGFPRVLRLGDTGEYGDLVASKPQAAARQRGGLQA